MSAGVGQLYKSVIEDVVNSVREVFLDESLDEHILQELKQTWENKLMQTKAVPPEGAHNEHDRLLQTFTIPSQQSQITTATTQAALKNARGIQFKYNPATVQQQLPPGSIVHPTLQYQYNTADLNDSSKTVTITLPQTIAGGSQKNLTIALPASALMQQGGNIVMSTSAAAAASALPPGLAAGLLQPNLTTLNATSLIAQNSDGTTVQYQLTPEQLAKQGYALGNVAHSSTAQSAGQVQQVQLGKSGGIIQLDGANDTSDEDEDDDFNDDNDGDNDDDDNAEENDGEGQEEEPLNSADDVSDEDPSELFDTDNVIVCQYDKITRSRNKWKFHLKDGIMNLQGKDFVFQRASGDAEW